jgi:hypothetical protein
MLDPSKITNLRIIFQTGEMLDYSNEYFYYLLDEVDWITIKSKPQYSTTGIVTIRYFIKGIAGFSIDEKY